jgi:hypothetical protein
VPAVAAAVVAIQPQREHTVQLKQQWRQLLCWLTRYIATTSASTTTNTDAVRSSNNSSSSGASVPVQPQASAVEGSQLFGLSTRSLSATGGATTAASATTVSTVSSTTTLLMWARDCTLHRVPLGRMDQPGRMDEVLQLTELCTAI